MVLPNIFTDAPSASFARLRLAILRSHHAAPTLTRTSSISRTERCSRTNIKGNNAASRKIAEITNNPGKPPIKES